MRGFCFKVSFQSKTDTIATYLFILNKYSFRADNNALINKIIKGYLVTFGNKINCNVKT